MALQLYSVMFMNRFFDRAKFKDSVSIVNTYIDADIEIKNTYRYLVDTCGVTPTLISIYSYDTDILV